MKLYHIVAVSENNVIGKDNSIPWKIKGDLPRFKALTMGKVLIMGRKTFESFGKYAPLPGRDHVVLTRQETLETPIGTATREDWIGEKDTGRIILVEGLTPALLRCEQDKAHEVYIIGGAEIYDLTASIIHEIRLTEVHREVEGGDAFYTHHLDLDSVCSYQKEHPEGTHTYKDLAIERKVASPEPQSED